MPGEERCLAQRDHHPALRRREVEQSRVDPITLELIKNALQSIVDEMALTVVRTAHSGVIKDVMDFSTGFCTASGEMIAQGLTLPLHLGAIPDAMTAVLRKYGTNVAPGDIIIMNDPFDGGMHLPDIFMFKPLFYRGELIGFPAVVCHHTDVGGRVAGSNASDSTEIYQEGLRIPPLKLYEAGVPNETLFALIEKNVRVPVKVLGDLRAQLAACHIAEREYLRLVERYGVQELNRYLEELLNYTERLARAEIAAMPDGEYSFTDYIDNDGIDPDPILLQVRVTVHGDTMTVDFSGTSPQVKGAINSTFSFTKSAVYLSVRCIMDAHIPNNA
ncbi:MAG: hydantoinase B/oxoprolinase family protein, partial [Nitrospinota bacterium]